MPPVGKLTPVIDDGGDGVPSRAAPLAPVGKLRPVGKLTPVPDEPSAGFVDTLKQEFPEQTFTEGLTDSLSGLNPLKGLKALGRIGEAWQEATIGGIETLRGEGTGTVGRDTALALAGKHEVPGNAQSTRMTGIDFDKNALEGAVDMWGPEIGPIVNKISTFGGLATPGTAMEVFNDPTIVTTALKAIKGIPKLLKGLPNVVRAAPSVAPIVDDIAGEVVDAAPKVPEMLQLSGRPELKMLPEANIRLPADMQADEAARAIQGAATAPPGPLALPPANGAVTPEVIPLPAELAPPPTIAPAAPYGPGIGDFGKQAIVRPFDPVGRGQMDPDTFKQIYPNRIPPNVMQMPATQPGRLMLPESPVPTPRGPGAVIPENVLQPTEVPFPREPIPVQGPPEVLQLGKPTAPPGVPMEYRRQKFGSAADLPAREASIVPETPKTLAAQVDAMRNGRVQAVLVTEGAPRPKVPPGHTVTLTKVGRFIHDPKKVSAAKIRAAVSDGTHGRYLGHVEPKPVPGAPAATVSASNKGVELKTSVVSPASASRQAQELGNQFPGADVKVGGKSLADEVVEARKIPESIGATPPPKIPPDLRGAGAPPPPKAGGGRVDMGDGGPPIKETVGKKTNPLVNNVISVRAAMKRFKDPASDEVLRRLEKRFSDERVLAGRWEAKADEILDKVSPKQFEEMTRAVEAGQKNGLSDLLDDVAKEAGEGFNYRENYWTHTAKPEFYEKLLTKKGRDDYWKWLDRQNISDNEKGLIIKQLLSRDRTFKSGNLSKARKNLIPPDMIRRDSGVVVDYLQRAAKHIAENKNLGVDAGEVTYIANQIVDETAREFTQRAIKQSLKHGGPAVTAGDRANRTVRAANQFLLGPATTVMNAFQRGSVMAVRGMGLKNTLKALAAAHTKAGRRFATESGVLSGDLYSKFGHEIIGSGKVGRAASKYLDVVQFTRMERQNRQVSAAAGKYLAKDMFKLLKKKGDTFAREVLEDLGVNVEAALKRGGLSHDDVVAAAQKVTGDVNFYSTPLDMPISFTSSETAKTLFQFKGAAYQQGKFVKDVVKNITKDILSNPTRAALPMLYLTAYLQVAGEITADAKTYLKGKPLSSRPTGLKRIGSNYAMGPGLGLLTDVFQSSMTPFGGYGGLAESAIGPTFGTAAGITANVAKGVGGMAGGDEKSVKSAGRALAGTAAGRVPVIGGFLRGQVKEALKAERDSKGARGSRRRRGTRGSRGGN